MHLIGGKKNKRGHKRFKRSNYTLWEGSTKLRKTKNDLKNLPSFNYIQKKEKNQIINCVTQKKIIHTVADNKKPYTFFYMVQFGFFGIVIYAKRLEIG
jgi:hypothetical protein